MAYQDERLAASECVSFGDVGEYCSGAVEYRMALSGTGISYPRCEAHWDQRVSREEQLRERYPQQPPPDWSPDLIGESWDEEDY